MYRQLTRNNHVFFFFVENFTFLLAAGIDFDGVAGSCIGLVLRLFENFLRFRFNAANAPNPTEKIHFL